MKQDANVGTGATAENIKNVDCLDHQKGDCLKQGCKQRHRRRCKYWGTGAGCYRGVQCQDLHVVDHVVHNEELKKADNESNSNI